MLERSNPELARGVKKLVLEARVLKVSTTAQRLQFVSEQYELLTVESAYQLLDPSVFQHEIEEAQNQRVDIWYTWRNLFAFLLLLWLLFSASFAIYKYQQALAIHPGDSNQSFFILWLNGFHGISPLTLTITVIASCLPIVAGAICQLQAQWLKIRAHKFAKVFAYNLQSITNDLIVLIANNNAPTTPSDINADRIIEALQQGIDRAFLANNQLTENAKGFIHDLAQRTNEAIEQAMLHDDQNADHVEKYVEDVKVQTELVLKDFEKDLGTFNADVTKLTNNLNTTNTHLQKHDDQLVIFTGATKEVTDLSARLAISTKEMTDSATENAKASHEVVTLAGDISKSLVALNTTQTDMVREISMRQQQVVETIEQNQKEMVKELTSAQQQIVTGFERASDKLQEVAKDTKQIAKELSWWTQTDIQKIATTIMQLNQATQDSINKLKQQSPVIKTSDVQEMIDQTKNIVDTLSQLDTTLKTTVKQLQDTQLQTNNPNLRKRTSAQIVKLEPENLRFTAYYPKVVIAETWKSLLVYAYIASALQEIIRDVSQRTKKIDSLAGEASAAALHPLHRGTRITIIPSCQGITFSPQEQSFEWTEDWYMRKFRFRAEKSLTGSLTSGEIMIYAGPVIIATLNFSIQIAGQKHTNTDTMIETTSKPCEKIFASYSHKDKAIVLACEAVQKSLGNNYFIDYKSIPAGANWEKELEKGIDNAYFFQLFWSANAARSGYVQKEWEYALTLKTKGEKFIYPTYWEEPMEPIPNRLKHIQFVHLDTSLFDFTHPRRSSIWNIFSIFK